LIGKPEFRAHAYFALGDESHQEAQSNLMDYYRDWGAEVRKRTVKTAEETKERVKAFDEVGCDELVMFMSGPTLVQADRLAEAVL
jgi:hypothetical protein